MTMQSLVAGLVISCIATIASASPFPEAKPDPVAQISVPSLGPSVPGFDDPIGTLTPPLPVLQPPTPAAPSPPFEGSDLKPKKIGYFWTGAGDKDHAGLKTLFVHHHAVIDEAAF